MSDIHCATKHPRLATGFGAAAALFAILFSPVAAATTMTFDTAPVLSASQAPGVWYTDRFAPAGFTSTSFLGDNRLALTLSAADGANNRPASFSSGFYNTQGRKFDTGNSTFLSVDFYIDSAFETAGGRIGGLWGTAVDGSDTITAFPIIEFHSDGTQGSFNIWDGAAFNDVGLPGAFTYDQFYNLDMQLVGNTVEYRIDGNLVFTDGDSGGSLGFSNVILQGINTTDGVDRTLYFDNLSFEPVSAPAPATAALALLGIAAVAWRRRRS